MLVETTPTKARAAGFALVPGIVGPGKRRWLTFFSCILILLAAFMLLIVFKEPKSDEDKYHRIVQAIRLTEKFPRPMSYHWLPPIILRPLNDFMNKPIKAYNKQEPLFLASGFLTNLTVTLTNASTTFAKSIYSIDIDEISRRIHKVAPDDFLPTSIRYDYETSSVTIEVTCPVRDVPSIRKAFESD